MSSESDIVTVVVGRFDPLVGRGLIDVLREDYRLRVLASGLGRAALERVVVQQAPRVVILDETAGHSLLARLRSVRSATGVLVLTYAPTRTDGMRLLAAGATCLAWSASGTDILAAIHLTAQGGRMFVSADGYRIERRYPNGMQLLTPREAEVLEHLTRDRSYAQIALALQISENTVQSHVRSVLRKLNVPSKRDLVGLPLQDLSEATI